MKKYFISIFLVVYFGILIQVLVYKNIPAVRYNGVMLNLGGTESGRPANLIPFKSILSYLLHGGVISAINVIGNIALLVPVGLLLPLIFTRMSWSIAVAVAVASGLAVELSQVILQVGIFDIDDVILNGLGVVIGYWIYTLFMNLPVSEN